MAIDCYECTAYGNDYYLDENGEWVSACKGCPNNEAAGGREMKNYTTAAQSQRSEIALKIKRVLKTEKNGVEYEYVPCRRVSDGRIGFVCAKNREFIEANGELLTAEEGET